MKLFSIVAGLFACVAAACITSGSRGDRAEFLIDPGGQVTASVNDRPVALPTGFALVMHDEPGSDMTSFSIYARTEAPNSYGDLWCGGLMSNEVYHHFRGYIGRFASIRHPNDGTKPSPVDDVLAGYPLTNLTGEPIRIDVVSAGTRVRIGEFPDPVRVQDIFDFLEQYFANDAAADFNHDGRISVQDIFDFLADYFGGGG